MCNGGADDGDIGGCCRCCLQCCGCVCHNQINIIGNKFCCNRGAVCLLALCVLIIEFYLIAQKLCQLILKALCCLIQCRVLQLLNDADCICFACISGIVCRIIAAAGCQCHRCNHHCGCHFHPFFHKNLSLFPQFPLPGFALLHARISASHC